MIPYLGQRRGGGGGGGKGELCLSAAFSFHPGLRPLAGSPHHPADPNPRLLHRHLGTTLRSKAVPAAWALLNPAVANLSEPPWYKQPGVARVPGLLCLCLSPATSALQIIPKAISPTLKHESAETTPSWGVWVLGDKQRSPHPTPGNGLTWRKSG